MRLVQATLHRGIEIDPEAILGRNRMDAPCCATSSGNLHARDARDPQAEPPNGKGLANAPLPLRGGNFAPSDLAAPSARGSWSPVSFRAIDASSPTPIGPPPTGFRNPSASSQGPTGPGTMLQCQEMSDQGKLSAPVGFCLATRQSVLPGACGGYCPVEGRIFPAAGNELPGRRIPTPVRKRRPGMEGMIPLASHAGNRYHRKMSSTAPAANPREDPGPGFRALSHTEEGEGKVFLGIL